jgi:hypothetical protein
MTPWKTKQYLSKSEDEQMKAKEGEGENKLKQTQNIGNRGKERERGKPRKSWLSKPVQSPAQPDGSSKTPSGHRDPLRSARRSCAVCGALCRKGGAHGSGIAPFVLCCSSFDGLSYSRGKGKEEL